MGARVDAATGQVSWVAHDTGLHSFVLRLDNDAGSNEQAFEVRVPRVGDSDVRDSGAVDDSDPPAPDDTGDAPDTQAPAEGEGVGAGGCGCGARGGAIPPLLPLLLTAIAVVRRRELR